MRYRKPIPAAWAVFVLACACSPLLDVRTDLHEESGREPKPKDFPVELIRTDTVNLPYKIIGTLSIRADERRDPASILERLKAAARNIGADALLDYTIVVPLEKGGIPTGWVRYTAEAVVFEPTKP